MRRLFVLGISVLSSLVTLIFLFSILSSSAAAVASVESKTSAITLPALDPLSEYHPIANLDQAASSADKDSIDRDIALTDLIESPDPSTRLDRSHDQDNKTYADYRFKFTESADRQTSEDQRQKRNLSVDWAYLAHESADIIRREAPATALMPQGAYSLTLETIHRNTNPDAYSSTFIFTNTGGVTSSYLLHFYWPNGQYQASDGPFNLGADASLIYDMNTANIGISQFAGKVVIDGDQPITAMITSPDYGLIAGTVYEDDGSTPLTSAWIDIVSWPNGEIWYANPPVLSDGKYYAGGLPDGDYVVMAGAGYPWAKQWYNGHSEWRNADPVNISSASVENDIDFILQPGGLITGTVYADDGVTPLENINVDLDQGWFGTCTDADGNYEIYGVPYGEHLVLAGRGWNWCINQPSVYVLEYYPETYDYDQAVPVPVKSGNDIAANIDFTLEVGAKITGRVVEAESGNPVPHIWVSARDYDSNWFWNDAETDASGYYTITGLIEGDYRVRANDYDPAQPEYAIQFYDGVFWRRLASRVSVPISGTVSGIDFALELGGSISGVIVDESTGAPLANQGIDAWMPAGGGTGACSDATGHFTVRGLAYGEYIVNAGGSWNYCAEQPGTHAREYYDGVYLEDDATLVAVSSALSQVVDINFNLDTGGFISGHVEDDTGAPLQDFWVELYLPTGQCPDCTNWYDDSFTDENGDYTLGPLPELDFGVYACADCNGLLLVNEYYNNVYSFIDADLVHVISGTTISNINFHMDAGILLTGTVSVPTGYSAENLRVNVWRDDAPDYWATTNTDSAGLYQIPVPPIYDREWVVRVRPLGTDLESKWARYFDIAAQTQWDFDLEAGGVITGIITSGGVPVSGAWVNAHSDWIGNGDDSDSNGYYRIENLPPGKYYVSADGWPDYAYNDYDTGYPWWSSLAVILERGETRGGINIDVGEISQIEGYVYEADGSTPVEGARISAMNDSQVYFGYSQSDGYFSVDVAAGDYRVYFDRGFEWEDGADIVPVYYPGASQWKNAAWVAAPAFGSIAINQNVQRPASLSGQVTENGSGNPLGGIHIAVQNIDPSVDREAAWWTCTDENGEYTIDGIWPGQTLVTAIGTCGNYNYEEITSTLAIVAGGNHNLNLGMSAGPPPERPFTMRTYDYSKTDYSAYAFGGAILSWDAAPILKALYSPLAQLNNRGEWVSDLLTSIPTVENGGAAIIGDQLYVTYTLKTGLLWSDGAALESYDIRFTWEKLIQAHPLVDDPWYTDYADLFKIENILTPNAQTAVVIYKPKYILPGYLETITYLLPEHTLAGEHPADVVFYSHFAHYPVSNGPYIVEKWVPGSHLDLRANPNYHASGSGLPLIREMRILFTGDPWDGLVNGFVDLGLDMAWYAPEDYQSYNLAAYHGFWNYFDALVPNTDLPFFADTQVRQALYHALDRQAFVDSYPPMQFSVGHSYLPPCNPMYTTTFSTYEFNLPLAATVLDSAGWVDSNGNGVRDKDGVEFEFDLGYLELSTERQKMAAIFQEDLASIGVDANLVPIPQSQINITRRFFLVDAYLQGWGFDNHFDPMAYELFHSSRVPSPYNSYRGSIFTGRWIDPAQDSLLESLVHELDFDRLKDAYADHLSLSSQQLPILPWRQWNQLDLSTPVLLNFKPGSTAIPTWNIAEWWVPPNPYDLSVRKALAADSPAPQPGSIITYEISVRNLGYFSMTSAALIDTLPEQVVYLGASPPPDAITDTRTMRWDLGDILGKSTHSPIKVAVQIPPTVTHGTWLTNSVQVSADQPDNHPGNNGFTHLAQVRDDVDLAVSKYGVGQPAIGEHFDYYINYGNWGGAPAANAVISDTLPPEVNLLSTSRIPSSSDGRTLTWNLGTLPGNQWGGQIKLTAEITQTGTVTNLAQISSSDPDVDLANNEEDHIEYVDDILKPVILRPTSGTTDGTPTVSGLAPSGSLVEIYDLASVMMAEQMNLPVAVQATLLYSTTAGSSGTFSVELSLAEGTYILAAKATKADLTSDYSNNVAIVVDHSLPLDPDMITISADGVDLSNGCVRADRHVLAYRLLDITAVLNCPSMPNNVRLQITENGLFTYYIGPSNLTSLGGGQWQVNFHAWLGEPHSSYEIRLLWECQGSAKSVLLLYILIDPDGYLYDQSLTDAGSAITDSLILNGVVTAYVKIADDWQAWPANIYGQVNPQFTDDATDDGVLTPGYYSFLTPSGKYRIEASAPGYQPYQSEVLTVITTPVHLNIPLQPVTGGSGFAKSPANLNGSSKVVNKTGDELTYDIWLANSGDEDTNSLSLQDFIPANTQYVDGSLTCSSGDADYDSGSGKIWWQGEVSGKQTVHIQYKLRVVSIPAYPLRPFTIVNTAQVNGSYVDTYLLPELTATVSIDIFDIYLPLVKK